MMKMKKRLGAVLAAVLVSCNYAVAQSTSMSTNLPFELGDEMNVVKGWMSTAVGWALPIFVFGIAIIILLKVLGRTAKRG